MLTRKHEDEMPPALTTTMDNCRQVAVIDPPQIASVQGDHAIAGLHPAAHRSPTDEVETFSSLVRRRSSVDGIKLQEIRSLAREQIEHCCPQQVAVIYRGESFDEVAPSPRKPFACFTIGLPWRTRPEASHVAAFADPAGDGPPAINTRQYEIVRGQPTFDLLKILHMTAVAAAELHSSETTTPAAAELFFDLRR